MIKNFKFVIDIEADITDKITPELVNGIVTEVDKENKLPNYQPQTDKLQAFIDYIKNNDSLYEECIAGNLFFKLSEGGFEEQLSEFLNPKCFDDIVIEKAAGLDSEIRDFVIQIYKNAGAIEEDAKIDEDGKPLPIRNSKKDIEDALKREIDSSIIHRCLLNYEITAASLKIKDE
ncbi:MAG TPA: hypothetical protein VK469_17120 [Candidatus Kapabacteria bacterium]|nr:hypothetical protein [Candidatus Kapabacteria bacterium]